MPDFPPRQDLRTVNRSLHRSAVRVYDADIRTNDKADVLGFYARVKNAGTVSFRPIHALATDPDVTETFAAGETIRVGNFDVLLQVVRANATVETITVIEI